MKCKPGPVDKLYDRDKNRIVIYQTQVQKIFKREEHHSRERFLLEQEALRRLHGQKGVPELLEVSEDPDLCITMSRLPGAPLNECEGVPDQFFLNLKDLVLRILDRGIARQWIKAGDVIVGPNGKAGIVDFERVTFRRHGLAPAWLIANAVNRVNLLQLISKYAPNVLNRCELVILWLARKLSFILYILPRKLSGRLEDWYLALFK